MRLDGGRVVDAWLATQPEHRHHLAHEALFAIVEGSWRRYRHWDDVVRRGIALEIAPGEILVWRRYVEYPDRFRVLYVGPATP